MLILNVLRLCLDVIRVAQLVQHGCAAFWAWLGAELYMSKDADPPKRLDRISANLTSVEVPKWKWATEIHLWVESCLLSQSLMTHIFEGMLVVHRDSDLICTLLDDQTAMWQKYVSSAAG